MDFAAARQNMVDCQILPSRVTDARVIEVMASLPRERFVPSAKQGYSYMDEAVGLGEGRYLMEPMITARLLQALELKSSDVALSIGCATGYSVAMLGRMVDTVVAVEEDTPLAHQANKNLAEVEIDNVAIIEGPLNQGAPKQAPYDVIFFDGAVQEIPDAILDQLGEQGRLIAIVEKSNGVSSAHLVTRHHGTLSGRDLFDAGTPLLPGFERERHFAF